jgi:damage-control phosphatase, subfamily I
VLEECNQHFRKIFNAADLIIAKGQGNYETLSDASAKIFFLFDLLARR